MNRDAAKHIGARNTSPVSSARRNSLILGKSSWSRISTDMKYHPYRLTRRQELKPEDLPRRIQFCTWIRTLTDNQLGKLVFSDEAYFELNGSVNSQNVRRYAPVKSSDPVNEWDSIPFFVAVHSFAWIRNKKGMQFEYPMVAA